MPKGGKTIYELELGETLYTSTTADSDTNVERVPGGWNYVYYRITTDILGNVTRIAMSAVFVPWHDEFSALDKQRDTQMERIETTLPTETTKTIEINAEGLEKRLKIYMLDLIAKVKNKQK